MGQVRTLMVALVALICLVGAQASPVFQFAVPVPREEGRPDGMAYLWIPPGADRIQGVVVAGKTTIELNVVKDPLIRDACAQEKLAIIFFNPSLAGGFNYKANPNQLQQVLDNLADVSGYREIKVAPIMSIGHSAGGPFSRNVAYWAPARCFGVLHIKSGGIGAPDFDPEARIYGVPYLQVTGQFDEFGGTMRNETGRETWEGSRDNLLKFRAEDQRYLFTLIVEPGAGHFTWNEQIAAYTAKYIRKAARARIPADWPVDATAPIACKTIDPATGWLTDGAINKTTEVAPAPCAKFTGDKARSFWHFDEEMAAAATALHAGQFGKKDQFLKWNDRYWVDAGVRHYLTEFTWVGDGQTFELHPAFADVYPDKWATKGQPVGHSDAPILLKRMNGAVEQVGPNTFRPVYDVLESPRYVIMAYSPATKEYRFTEVQCMVRNMPGLTKGAAQTITFPPVGTLKANSAPIDLQATSDSGLPVSYYVEYGPVIVEGGRLRIAEIPPRAKFPISVKVTAYQYGRALEPLVQSAEPVTQTFTIEQP